MNLILGKPRSKTAWIANFLTVPPVSFCYHEGLADSALELPRLRERMKSLPVRHAGNADTALIRCVDEIIDIFPDARLVLLVNGSTSGEFWRDLPEVVRRSIDAAYERACIIVQDRAYRCDSAAVTTNQGEAERLWNYCVPDSDFDAERWRMLKDLNIQVHMDSLRSRFTTSGGKLP